MFNLIEIQLTYVILQKFRLNILSLGIAGKDFMSIQRNEELCMSRYTSEADTFVAQNIIMYSKVFIGIAYLLVSKYVYINTII